MDKKISLNSEQKATWQPLRLNSKNRNFSKVYKKLLSDHPEIQIVDQYDALLEELFLLRNPKFRFLKGYAGELNKFRENNLGKKSARETGTWFYFPWNNTLVHYLPDSQHQELRTGRNKNLVTDAEQKQFYAARIGILGMSVGSHVALTIAMAGGGKIMKLADPDTLSGSNLNRIRTGFNNISLSKSMAVARQIFEMNPYAQITIYNEGINDANLKGFLNLGGKLNLLVEEMDNPYLKIKVREQARKLGIPIIMGADNGDGIIVDIERYDLSKKTPILNGLIGSMTSEEFKVTEPRDLPKTIAKIAGANIASLRMLESVTQVGKTLYSWPQLGNAATLCGSVLSYLARKIILKERIKTGRLEVNPDSIFETDYNSTSRIKKDAQKRKLLLLKIQQGPK